MELGFKSQPDFPRNFVLKFKVVISIPQTSKTKQKLKNSIGPGLPMDEVDEHSFGSKFLFYTEVRKCSDTLLILIFIFSPFLYNCYQISRSTCQKIIRILIFPFSRASEKLLGRKGSNFIKSLSYRIWKEVLGPQNPIVKIHSILFSLSFYDLELILLVLLY